MLHLTLACNSLERLLHSIQSEDCPFFLANLILLCSNIDSSKESTKLCLSEQKNGPFTYAREERDVLQGKSCLPETFCVEIPSSALPNLAQLALCITRRVEEGVSFPHKHPVQPAE